MPVHRLTITGEPASVRLIRDTVLAQHDAIVADDSWAVTEADGVLEFSTTEVMTNLQTPIVVMTFDVQVDAVQLAETDEPCGPPPRLPAPRRAGSVARSTA